LLASLDGIEWVERPERVVVVAELATSVFRSLGKGIGKETEFRAPDGGLRM
jgi:hypothetical protein